MFMLPFYSLKNDFIIISTKKNYMNKKTELHLLLSEALTKGFAQLSSGVSLCSSTFLLDEQKEWCNEDGCKTFSFETAPFWLVTDSGQDPEAVYTVEDLIQYR